jgi:hypothetical protein
VRFCQGSRRTGLERAELPVIDIAADRIVDYKRDGPTGLRSLRPLAARTRGRSCSDSVGAFRGKYQAPYDTSVAANSGALRVPWPSEMR